MLRGSHPLPPPPDHPHLGGVREATWAPLGRIDVEASVARATVAGQTRRVRPGSPI